MATGTSAQVEAMTSAAQHVDAAGQALATIQGRIQTAIANTSSGYVSDAATLFRSVMDQWHQDFTKIVNGLENIRTALTSTQKVYESTMAQEQMSANQIAALLNGSDV
jgi:WXG100 family type VII secretion target